MATATNLKNSMGDYKAAEISGKEALQLAEKMGIPFFLANCHLYLSRSQRNLGLYADALQHAQVGYAIVEKDIRAGNLENFEEELFLIYKAMGEPKLALPLLEKAMERLKNRIGQDTKNAIADAETKYRTAEKEKQILELEITNEKISSQRNYIMSGGLLLSLFGFFGYRLNKVQKDRNDKKAFAEALIYAQEEERKRIARDLHDGVGQSLLLIKKQLSENTGVTLENQRMISDTLEEVRSISQDLHPFQLEKFGLTNTINDMVDKVEKSTDIFVTKEMDDIDNILPPKAEIHLYRTIQEALSNILKHAGATAAKVSIKNKPAGLEVVIQDNGKGFDLEMAVVASKSLGIKTMHERISSIGGHLKISHGENGGTQININIPKK
jgi:signal transduction histidine kinase